LLVGQSWHDLARWQMSEFIRVGHRQQFGAFIGRQLVGRLMAAQGAPVHRFRTGTLPALHGARDQPRHGARTCLAGPAAMAPSISAFNVARCF